MSGVYVGTAAEKVEVALGLPDTDAVAGELVPFVLIGRCG